MVKIPKDKGEGKGNDMGIRIPKGKCLLSAHDSSDFDFDDWTPGILDDLP